MQSNSFRCAKQESENVYEPQNAEDLPGCPKLVITGINELSKLFSNQVCGTCKETSLHVVASENYGFSQKIKVVCDTCDALNIETFSSMRMTQSNGILKQSFDINICVVQALMSFVKGYSACTRICM